MGTSATATFLVMLLLTEVNGHGMLMEPPSRSSMWRLGYPNPQNYNDNSLYCGGFAHRIHLGNKCGVCGDPWDGPRDNEAGGKYANGVITAHYKPGQDITIRVTITASHMGWFEFRLCPNNDVKKEVKQECLDKHLLPMSDGSGTRYILKESRVGDFLIHVKLPDKLTCKQCVLQWKWKTGNSWGVEEGTGRGCVGCGEQEEFYGCSDIAIQSDIPETLGTTHTIFSTSTIATTTPTDKTTCCKPPPAVSGQKCWATNLWAGNPFLDAFCQKTCDNGDCPSVGCICDKIKMKMTDTTTVTTESSPAHKIPQRDDPSLFPLQGLVCKAADLWEGDPKLDRHCQEVCSIGNCPSYGCRCTANDKTAFSSPETTTDASTTTKLSTLTTSKEIAETPTTTNAKPASAPGQICKAIGKWSGFALYDQWCQQNCDDENCPMASCKCIPIAGNEVHSDAKSTQGPTTITTTTTSATTTTQRMKVCGAGGSLNGEYWNDWCKRNCAQGYCPAEWCVCT